MTAEPKRTLKLFYSYSHEDKSLRDALDLHLSSLKRQRLVTVWHDHEILPGSVWEQEIDTHLNEAHIILLLISPNFMASEYCWGREMEYALARHEQGTARVIPILIRPVDWEGAPFSKLQMLPTNTNPISLWPNLDAALYDVVKSIRLAVSDLLVSFNTKEAWKEEGNIHYHLKQYKEALQAFEQAIRLEPNDANAYISKGNTLNTIKRYQEALQAFDQAIQIDHNYAVAYINKGDTLITLKRYEEALHIFEQVAHLAPNEADIYINKAIALYHLQRYGEALQVFEQAINLAPVDLERYYDKSSVLYYLKCYSSLLRISTERNIV